MAEVPLGTGIHYFADPTKGKPVYFGSVYVGVADENPKILANRVSVILLQEDGTKVTLAPSAQPFVTGAGGQILYQGSVSVIKVTDAVSVRVDNQAGYQVNYNPRYNETDSITATLNEGTKPVNGSFEIENGEGIAANWLTSVVTGSITADSTESSHGLKSLKFSGIDATGSGTATSDKFNVQEGSENDLRFSYRSTSATTLNEVSVRYFDSVGAPVSVDTVHSDGATNPVTYTSYLYRSIAPATAVQADIFIDGVKSTGTTTTASTYFDGVFLDYNVENAVVETVGVVNGVNNVTAIDATTGNKPQINQTGPDDVGIDIEGVEHLNGTATAPNGFTGDLTGDVTGNVGDNLSGEITAAGNVITINDNVIGGDNIKNTIVNTVNSVSISASSTVAITETGFLYIHIDSGASANISLDLLVNGVWTSIERASSTGERAAYLFSIGTNIRMVESAATGTGLYSIDKIED